MLHENEVFKLLELGIFMLPLYPKQTLRKKVLKKKWWEDLQVKWRRPPFRLDLMYHLICVGWAKKVTLQVQQATTKIKIKDRFYILSTTGKTCMSEYCLLFRCNLVVLSTQFVSERRKWLIIKNTWQGNKESIGLGDSVVNALRAAILQMFRLYPGCLKSFIK